MSKEQIRVLAQIAGKEDIKNTLKLLQEIEQKELSKDVNQQIKEHYMNANNSLIKEYFACIRSDDFEKASMLSRQLYPLAKQTKAFAEKREESCLYTLGMFNGIYASCKRMVELQSEEKLFFIQMSKLIERKHVKDVLRCVYRGEYVQNKRICKEAKIEPNLLSKVLHPLLEVDCLVRYENGRNTFYSLSRYGKIYAKKVLGYKKNAPIEEKVTVVTHYENSSKYVDVKYEILDSRRDFAYIETKWSNQNEKYKSEVGYGTDESTCEKIR